jgi:hypothetical protein
MGISKVEVIYEVNYCKRQYFDFHFLFDFVNNKRYQINSINRSQKGGRGKRISVI